MTDKSVVDILEELEATAGSLAKRDVLHQHRRNELLKQVFVAAGDPYTVWYVSKVKMPKLGVPSHDISEDEFVNDFIKTLRTQLATRKVTGNAAKALVESRLADMPSELCQKWCVRILLRNLRVGVQESTVNKVWPGTLKSFAVALAETLKSEFVKGEGIKLLEPVTYPVRVEPKLDGLRCIAVKKDGVVTCYTRNGTVIENMPTIKAALEAASYDNVVLDGEGMAADWNQSSSIMMSGRGSDKGRAKDDSGLIYNVFDAVPLADWVAQKTELTYAERCKLVYEVILACTEFKQGTKSPVCQVPHIMAQDETELKKFFAKCLDDGFEGVMLKSMDAPYKWKRSDNIVKLKPVTTFEGVIVGHYEGRRGTKHEGRFGGFNVVLSNGVITRVGGGFNDKVRAEVQLDGADAWVGKIVEIEAQPDPLTTDGLTKDGKARFPVYTRCRDASDVDPKVLRAYAQWTQENP